MFDMDRTHEAARTRTEAEPATLRIDPELRNLIPPLSEIELQQLEDSIRSEGCRDALVVWNDVIVDGHNRFDICNRLGLPYETMSRAFADKGAARCWMLANQLGRRNLSSDAQSQLRGRLYEEMKKRVGAPDGSKNAAKNNAPTVGALFPRTADEVAKAAGVSPSSVYLDASYVRALDALESDEPGFTAQRGVKGAPIAKLTRKDVVRLAAESPSKRREVIDAIKGGANVKDAYPRVTARKKTVSAPPKPPTDVEPALDDEPAPEEKELTPFRARVRAFDAQVASMWDQGDRIVTIAKQTKKSQGAVQNSLRRQGLTEAKPHLIHGVTAQARNLVEDVAGWMDLPERIVRGASPEEIEACIKEFRAASRAAKQFINWLKNEATEG